MIAELSQRPDWLDLEVVSYGCESVIELPCRRIMKLRLLARCSQSANPVCRVISDMLEKNALISYAQQDTSMRWERDAEKKSVAEKCCT